MTVGEYRKMIASLSDDAPAPPVPPTARLYRPRTRIHAFCWYPGHPQRDAEWGIRRIDGFRAAVGNTRGTRYINPGDYVYRYSPEGRADVMPGGEFHDRYESAD